MQSPEIELFEILIAAAESKNLMQAAAKLKISQPAVSVKLKALDRQAPLPIFTYEGKRKVLTVYGRELYRIAKLNQVRMAAALEDLNRKFASAEALTLSVGARRELFEALAPKLRFAGRIVFRSMTSSQAVEMLLARKIDIAIGYSRPDSPEIIAKKVLESSAKFVVHRKFAKSAALERLVNDEAFLRETPCVLYSEEGHLLRDWINHHSIELDALKVSGVAEDWRSVQSLVNEAWGYAVVPSYIETSLKDVVSVDLPESVLPKFVFYAMYLRDLKKIPAFSDVLKFTSADP